MNETEISNLALGAVEAKRIGSFGGTANAEERAITDNWEVTRKKELARYDWNFAMTRGSLTVDATAPAWGYTYRHALPSTCLRLIEVYGITDYRVEGGYILSSSNATMSIRYINDVDNTTFWHPCFIDAFSYALGLKIAPRLSASESVVSRVAQLYRDAVMEARRADAIENLPEDPPEDDWNVARD